MPTTKPDILPAAQQRVAQALDDAGGDRDVALLSLALQVEAALLSSCAGFGREPPGRG